MKETIDLLGKIITNILTALYEPFGFSLLLSFLAPQKAKINQNSEWQEKSQEFGIEHAFVLCYDTFCITEKKVGCGFPIIKMPSSITKEGDAL